MPSFLEREDIQLAEPFSERRLLNQGRFRTTWYPPYILQPKLNGERCRAIKQGDRCLLLSSTNHIIATVLHINQAMLSLPDGEYDGELYVHGWTFSEIHSVVSSTTTIHPRAHEMEFHIFDMVNEESQIERLTHLAILLPQSRGPIHRVAPDIANNMTEIMSLYDRYIGDGYEGFIIRHIDSLYVRKRSQLMMKFKPKEKDVYLLLSVNEAISESGTPKGMVGSFWCVDDMDTRFKVGAGKLKHPKRIEYWQMWLDNAIPPGTLVKLEYQCMSDKDKVPLFSRTVGLIFPTCQNSTQQQGE